MYHRMISIGVAALPLLLSFATQKNDEVSGVPQLVDPGFENFKLAEAPLGGWFSDDASNPNNPNYARLSMTADSEIKAEGQYSVRIEQTKPRPPERGQAFLAQAVRLPRDSELRNFHVSVQMRGDVKGPITIHVYVWEHGNVARAIAQRDVIVNKEWHSTVINFKVPKGFDQFGIWFYLPRREDVRLWLDDIRLSSTLR